MFAISLTALSLLGSTFAQQCQPVSQILPNPERYFERNAEEFPTDIYRVFQGSLSRQCDALPGVFQRDPTLCLKDDSGREKCNLCAPSPQGQFFKYPFWSEFNAIKEEGPRAFGNSEARTDVTHCLRCFAWALPYNASLNGGIPIDPASDIIKSSVTVSTRVACADEKVVSQGGKNVPAFQQPDAQQLQAIDDKVEALGISKHPCIVYLTVLGPPGQRYCNMQDFQQRQQQAAALLAQKEKYIESFAMKWQGEAVNGHKEALMEIPFGQMHLIQARVSAQPGYEGWTADPPLLLDQKYTYQQVRPSTPQGQYGCSVFEYGMVVASPGQVRTACWLTPMFKEESARAAWIQSEREKEASLQQTAFTAVRDNLLQQSETAEKECRQNQGSKDPILARFCKTFCAQQAQLAAQGLGSQTAGPVCAHWNAVPDQPPPFAG